MELPLHKLKLYESKEILYSDFVELFGTQSQINRLKSKGLTKAQQESISKIAKQYYESVKIINSRPKKVRLGKLVQSDKPLVKESWKGLNKRKQLAKSIDLLLLSVLVEDNKKLDGQSYTVNKWMKEIGFVSTEEDIDSRRIKYGSSYITESNKESDEVRCIEELINKLESEQVIEKDETYSVNVIMLKDYFATTSLYTMFIESLNRLERAKIIYTNDFPKAKLKDVDKYINLNEQQLDAILTKKVELNQMIEDKKIKKNEYYNYLKDFYEHIEYVDENGDKQVLSIDFEFTSKFIKILTTKNRTLRYIKENGSDVLEDYISNKGKLWEKEINILKAERRKKMMNDLNKKYDNKIAYKEKNKGTLIGTKRSKEESLLSQEEIENIERYRDMYTTAFEKLEKYYSKKIFRNLLS